MKLKTYETGMIKELLKEVKMMDRRLKKIERVVPVERLTASDIKEIEKSEKQIKQGKYRTLEQVKKELGIR